MIRVAGAVLAVSLLFACEKKSGNEVRMVNPNELLFSLPTLCDALPATVPEQVPPGTFTMPEDDWR